MRRHRFPHTLPSEDESSFFLDSDNLGSFHYPEAVWPQITSSEPDSLIPYYVYQYPFVQVPTEPMPLFPGYINASLYPETFNTFDDFYPNNFDLSSVYSSFDVDTSSVSSLEDGLNTKNIHSCIDVSTAEPLNNILQDEQKVCPKVTNYGAVTLLLRHLIRVDISPTKAVYVTNPPAECIAAINGVGDKSCVIHPNGRVFHIGQDIHMKTLNRRAKICSRGIIFSSSGHCLTYRVDDSGTKTTSEKMRNLDHDFSLEVFYCNSLAENSSEECHKMVNEAQYKSYRNGDEVWMIGGFRIKQDLRGDVKVTRNGYRYVIKTSPTSGQIATRTISADICIGRYPHNYFSVTKGNKVVTASVKRFIVKHGTQKSGFNSSGKVALF